MDLVLFVMLLLRFEMDFFRLQPTSNCANSQSLYRVCVGEDLIPLLCLLYISVKISYVEFCVLMSFVLLYMTL
ncbi:hypothetical protein OIU76_000661 [Salix suchowensis]|nr:hypothetical protein OIU76_000661 [Salix suchowensis]